ncbi:MAG TPA: LysR family transcriptional regulator [Bradyrhizobium sp.]|nr:LysR family transcriptional regulator [Bradyrhizobium sp.]
MDLRKLRYFMAVAEELHFGRAARRLRMSQPPLSIQIRALEDELGTSLFVRDRRNVALTDAGRVLQAEGRSMLRQVDQVRTAVQRAGRGETGRLSIGFITPVEYNVLPGLLGEFRLRYPAVSLTLREVMSDQQLAELESGLLDVGLLTAPVDRPTLEHHVVWRERLIVAIPAAHELARSTSPISIRRLAERPFVMFPRSIAPVLYDDILQFCRDAGFSMRIAQEAPQSQTIVSLVSAGLGLAILPDSIRGLRRTGVAYRAFREQSPSVETVVAYNKHRPSPAVENFVRFARKQL